MWNVQNEKNNTGYNGLLDYPLYTFVYRRKGKHILSTEWVGLLTKNPFTTEINNMTYG